MKKKADRYMGSLVGLAVGDAVGTTLEFQPPGTFLLVSDMAGGGPFGLNPGEWTDDTSMALCLAASLVERGFDKKDQLDRYCRWQREGYMSSNGICFDIGNTVASALSNYKLYHNEDSGSKDPATAGNGSIMRLAPVPMYYGNNASSAILYSGESSKTTHGTIECIDACRYFGGLIWGALNGVAKEELLSPDYPYLGDTWNKELLCPSIKSIVRGSYKQKKPPEIRGSGYVVQSLEAALWAFYSSEDFASGCLLAVNLGEDADTTGAVYGQIAGAYYGFSAIPETWREKIKYLGMIVDFSNELIPKQVTT